MGLLCGYVIVPFSLSFQTVMLSYMGGLVQNRYSLNSLAIDLKRVTGNKETMDTYTEKLALGEPCTLVQTHYQQQPENSACLFYRADQGVSLAKLGRRTW